MPAGRNAFSRRTFLQGVAALAGASIIGCRTAPLTEKQVQFLQKFDEMHARPPLLTELRSGSSVKKVIEELAEQTNGEIVLAKQKPGRVKNYTIESNTQEAHTIFPRGTKTILHSHLQEKDETLINRKLTSLPSIKDILSLTGKDNPFRQKNTKLKFYHIAVLDYQRRVIGYYSLSLGKNIRGLINPTFWERFSSAQRRFSSIIDKMKRIEIKFHQIQTPAAAEKYLKGYNDCLTALQKMGLHIRQTPMPGYTFKEGYFQPKLMKKV
jgi:hypothetical protein